MASARALVVTAVLLACLLAGPADGACSCPSNKAVVLDPANEWDQSFTFTCPENSAISRVQSVHCNKVEDRVWRFGCKYNYASDINSLPVHDWTSWINDYDKYMNFDCPSGKVVTGFKSEHDNKKEDRRWKLRCSGKPGMETHSCRTTDYVNHLDLAMDYFVPPPYYVTGMHGEHDNYYEDRRYGFTICKVSY